MLADPDVLIALVAAFVASILGGLSGFGAGVLVLPFLIPIVGAKGAVPVLAVAMFVGNLSRYWVFRNNLDKPLLGPLALWTTPGVIIGALIYQSLPERAAAAFVGVFLIAMVGLRRWLKGRELVLPPGGVGAVGFGFGVVTGATPGAGVILVSVLLGMGLAGPTLIATDAVIGMLVSILRAAVFSGSDLLDLQGWTLGILVGLATFPGAFTARWLTDRLSASLHVALIEAMVITSGCVFLWEAFRSPVSV